MIDWGSLFQIGKIVSFLLILFRVLGVFLAAPLLGNRSTPMSLQIGFSIVISFLVLPFVEFNNAELLSSDVFLVRCIIQEVTIGVLIGFASAVLFSAIQCAGDILGIKIGFSIATIIDPSNNGSSGVLGSLYILLGALMFLYLNGHHLIIKSLVDSFFYIPLGEGFRLEAGAALGDMVAKVLIVSIKIAAPVVIVLTLLNLIFGFITKLSPQMNIYFNIGFILGPILGIFTLILSLPLFRVIMTNLTTDFGPELIRLVRELKGA